MATRATKFQYSKAHIRRVRLEVIRILSQRDPVPDLDLVTDKLIVEALHWSSAYEAEPDSRNVRVPLAEKHQAENISRYLPRNLLKLRQAEPANLPLGRMSRKDLSPAHGVAYALAIALQEDAARWTVVRECRQAYFQQDTAKFPWLASDGTGRYREAVKDADDWMGEQVQEGAGRATLSVHVQIKQFEAVYKEVQQFGYDTEENPIFKRGQLSLSAYLRQLADILDSYDIRMLIHQLGRHKKDPTRLTWKDRTLQTSLPFTPVRVTNNGPLGRLHTAVEDLAKVSGWSAIKALEFILTGHPPVPRLDMNKPQAGRAPAVLSFDHIALLQLKYTTPNQSWPARLRQWDRWLAAFPEEKLTLTFSKKEEQGGFVTADSQRAAWMASETKRAQARAAQFMPYIREDPDRREDKSPYDF